jgi:tetratricopeptide (TPR) repeat protein
LGRHLTVDQLAAAHEALRLVLVDPVGALRAAERTLATTEDPAVRVVALRAAGQALAETADLPAAAAALRAAVDLAARHGRNGDETAARVSLSGVLAAAGRIGAALRELDRAARTPQVLAQRGFLLARAGRTPEALACFRAALPGLRRAGDRRFEAILLLNRGALYAERGDLPAAERDLNRCVAVATTAGLGQLVADARNNLGCAAAAAGNLAGAFAAFDVAECTPGVSAAQLAATRLDRTRALLAARLAADAMAEAHRVLPLLDLLRRDLDRADAELLLAEAALLAGDHRAARVAAVAAAERLRAQRRHGWAALACHLEVRARFESGERGPELTAAVRRDVRRLDGAGWPAAAIASRILLARLLIEHDRTREAAQVLAPAGRPRPGDPAQLRIAAWHAQALRRRTIGDHAGAIRAARSGIRAAQDHALAAGVDELRSHAADHGSGVAELGLELCLATGRPEAVLRWSEEHRAAALLSPPARPSRDAELARDLAALRSAGAQLAERIAAGGDPGALRRERDRAERAVRDRVRRTASRSGPRHGSEAAEVAVRVRRTASRAGPVDRFDPTVLATRLAGRGLVSYLVSAGRLHAVSLVDRRHRLHHLGPFDRVVAALEAARFAALRIGCLPASGARRAALEHAVAVLDAALCHPLPEVAGRDLVLVPTADLFRMPWSLLPSWRGASVVVSPSARLWSRPATGRRDRRVVLVSGPGLVGAGQEVAALAKLHPGATMLAGSAARVEPVLRALDGAALAHLACHGDFREAGPLFSALHLADGPLFVHDLLRLRRPPRTLILSACDSARCTVRPGDEILGPAAALLAGGTRTVIAAVNPVADTAAKALMPVLHRHLLDGRAAGQALAAAAAETDVHGFVCLGDG